MYLYGFNRFGEEQAEKYFYEIEECINLLADTPLMSRERTEFIPPVRIHRHASHLIIYIIQTDHIFIVRVLHDSMDIQKHLI